MVSALFSVFLISVIICASALKIRFIYELTGVRVAVGGRFILDEYNTFVPNDAEDALNFLYGDEMQITPNFKGKQPMFIDNKFVLRYDYFPTVSSSFGTPVEESEKRMWEKVFRSIEEHTCLAFREIDASKTRDPFPVISIWKMNDKECTTERGRSMHGITHIRFKGCERAHHVLIRELMHALGYINEHQRPDRDNFIKIIWGNVAPGMESQFTKVDWSPKFAFDIFDDRYYYDYYSIMHYPHNAFAGDRRWTTIVPKCAGVPRLQTRRIFTEIDTDKLRFYYGCWRFKFLIDAYKDKKEYFFNTKDNSFGYRKN